MTLKTGQDRLNAMRDLVSHVEEFGNRETYAQLAQRFGLSKSSVHEALQDAGLTYRSVGKRPVTLPDMPDGVSL